MPVQQPQSYTETGMTISSEEEAPAALTARLLSAIERFFTLTIPESQTVQKTYFPVSHRAQKAFSPVSHEENLTRQRSGIRNFVPMAPQNFFLLCRMVCPVIPGQRNLFIFLKKRQPLPPGRWDS